MNIQHKLVGQVAAVLIGQDKQSFGTSRQPQVAVSFAGFEGDKHAGLTHLSGGRTPHYPRGTEIRNGRQVTIVSVEELAQIAAAMGVPEILPEWLGVNLLLQGIPQVTQLPPATRLFFPQGAALVVEQDNLPCAGPGKIMQAHYGRPELAALFPKAALGKRGVVACVERPGVIAEGDEVSVEVPEQVIYLLDQSR